MKPFLFKRPGEKEKGQVDTAVALLPDADEEPLILCAACGEGIASFRDRMEVDGAFTHVFSNPCGMVFEIGCFGKAPGCRTAGLFAMEFTWFPGCAWRYALCSGCGTHLGWQYRQPGGGEMFFFGLILERLVLPRRP